MKIYLLAACLMVGSASAMAQGPLTKPANAIVHPVENPKTPPELTPDERKDLTLLLTQLENAQLKAQLAQVQFDQVRAALGDKLKAVDKPGWTFDVQTMKYIEKPDGPPKLEPKKDGGGA